MQASIVSAEVRRPFHGPDAVTLQSSWGEFRVALPRGTGPDYVAAIGLGSCKLLESDGFEPKTTIVELGPKSRRNDQKAEIAFASAKVTEPVSGGAVTLILDTRGGDGSNDGAYEHDFELAFDSLAAAKSYLKDHGFESFVRVCPRVRANGKSMLLPEVEKI